MRQMRIAVLWVLMLATPALAGGEVPAMMTAGGAGSPGWLSGDGAGLVATFEESLDADERRELTRALGKGIGAYLTNANLDLGFDDTAYDGDYIDTPFCAFVSGSAGTPRLGGGGPFWSVDPNHARGVVPNEAFPSAASPRRPLVIVDDFGAGPFGHRYGDSDDMELAPIELQLAEPQRLREAVFGATASVRADHGSIVLFHVLAMLGAGGATVAGVDPIASTATHRVTRIDLVGSAPIIVASFDFLDLDSLGAVMREVEGHLHQIPAVYNLSWNLADCTVLEMFRAARASLDPGDPEFLYRDFMRDLAGSDDEALNDIVLVCEAVLGRVGAGDPIALCADREIVEALVHMQESWRAKEWIRRLEIDAFRPETGNQIVAASGNESLPFPLAPAAWRCVIGVAASAYPSSDRVAWSNLGDFIVEEDETALGASFASGIPGVERGEFLFYGGTSFAAPVVALAIAAEDHEGVAAGCTN